MNKSQIAIIDFGSQYTHLITRRIRQLGVLANIYPTNVRAKDLKGAKGIILSGGPKSVHDKTAIKYDSKIFDLKVPILGLCYGHQLIAHHFGGQVKPGKTKEYGFASLQLTKPTKLLLGIKSRGKIWMSHGDSIKQLPKNFLTTGKTTDCAVAAMANEKQKIYGLQFHPEVAHTEEGMQILKNFVFKICQTKKDWSLDKYWQSIIKEVKKTVGKRKVFLLVSGGVDSTVCFAILEKILGKARVFGLHVDNGFMRLDESNQVKKSLAKAGFDDLFVFDASEGFLKATKNMVEPEAKRQAIGAKFLNVKDEVMALQKMNQRDWILAQGTIYPDTIETGGTKHADTIKTHHNRVKEVLKLMKLGTLVEPLATLYKDEVRAIGKKLGLPNSLINRHPFPGPGLSIRALCSKGNEKVKNPQSINKKLQKIVGPKLKAQALPIKSVGVQGDNRTYSHPAIIHGQASWPKLHDLSVNITNQLSEINRVVYVAGPGKVDFKKFKVKKAHLTKDRLDLLREIDYIVNQATKKFKIYKDIWQFPVVLAPLSLNGGETIILRPIQSQEAMTVNFYQMNRSILNKITSQILKIPGVDLVLYDVTNKPPGTIEWE
ncbi:MAG: glutamine-hydrolyzing GMP synthase [Parcubacteria group bacterium]|jgi:GMP synthase (glutamine-hydrolysing)|nr:glutamine-hydrolyzing GMP synthase [Parcubacteria group bacterium]|tara:strand:- start:3198 stop:5003 length:1806 start_codon:yes stop_codon:yes gene_type:complete